MNDQWVPGPAPAPPQWTNPLPPSNDWNDVAGCCPPGGPSIVDGVTITGVPATIVAPYGWGITLNDGAAPPNFTIDHYDGTNTLIDSPLEFSGVDGSATFKHPVYLSENPVQPMEAATKAYVDALPPSGVPEAPMDNYPYARYMATWERLPQAYIPEAPSGQIFARFNSTWTPVPIQADAPNDGGTYGRQNNAWNPALAISGGTITGSLTVNQVLTVQGSNSLVLNAPVTGGNQRAILSMAANVARWQLALGDGTAEGAGNAGANFTLAAYGVTGAFLGNWLTIARADGSTVFNGSGLTLAGGLAVNGTLVLADLSHLAIYGGSPGQFLGTNGSGILSWATPAGGGGGIADAPADGTSYARNNAAWAHLTHTDITDWTATLAPYALTTSVPVASNNAPLMNGTAAAGLLNTFSRADHVHPTDTSRYAASNPSGYQTAAQVTAALPPAATTTPLADGIAAIGTSGAFARADHVHPAVQIGDNRIINGDMRIDQRNNGAAGTASGYMIDRWFYGASQTGKFQWQRNTSGSGGLVNGFNYSLSFLSLSAYASLANDNFNFHQRIEADMIADFAWGTANAQPVTLSFWASSSLTGTFSGVVYNGPAATRSYPFTFSLPTANTWIKCAVTIPGDTAGTWTLQGNTEGLRVSFDLGAGSNLRGPANAWTSATYTAVTGAVSLVGTNSANFFLANVKLEIGSVATPFNRQSLAKSMADCQRYYEVCNALWTGDGTIGNTYTVAVPFAVEKRAAPTITSILQTGTSNGNFNARAVQATMAGPQTRAVTWGGTLVSTGPARGFNDSFSASAEL